MSQLQVHLDADRPGFHPGGELRGAANWQLDSAARKLELRLCWFTKGIGIPEVRVIETMSVDHPALDGRQSFAFRLPEAPLSYLGALSALWWAVELVVLPSQECTHMAFCLSPIAHPIPLMPLPDDEQAG